MIFYMNLAMTVRNKEVKNMMGKVHFWGGIACGFVTAYSIPSSENNIILLLSGAIMGGIGALLPDIDNKNSTISKTFPRISVLVCKFTTHRRFTHSLIIPIIFSLAAIGFYTEEQSYISYCVWAMIAGYIMHLFQDYFTKGGIPWLYPYCKNKYSCCDLRTGSKLEGFVTAVLIVLYIQIISIIVNGTLIKLAYI